MKLHELFEDLEQAYQTVTDSDVFQQFPGFAAAEEAWVGTVANFGDPEAAYHIQNMPGYDEYQNTLAQAVTEYLGDPFRAYRLMHKEQIEDWKNGADLPPMAVTLSAQQAIAFRRFAGTKDPENTVVIKIDVPTEAIIMRGHGGEQELVIDPNYISAHTVKVVA